MSVLEKKYKKIEKIGEGTYAVVYMGERSSDRKKIAIKKVRMISAEAGIEISAIREIMYLQQTEHTNVISILDVCVSARNVSLIMDYFEYDLEKIIKNESVFFSAGDVKAWMKMLLSGIAHCHSRWIVHRDLKPNNLLFNKDGVLKIADFGLAREFAFPDGKMTPRVVSRWYRAPELLYGAREYTDAIDIWACGCIFAELMLRRPFLQGDSDIHQLEIIFTALGTPDEKEWPGMDSLPNYFPLKKHPRHDLSLLFSAVENVSLNLLYRMLCFDPAKRISAEEALAHPYFTSSPSPTAPGNLPIDKDQ